MAEVLWYAYHQRNMQSGIIGIGDPRFSIEAQDVVCAGPQRTFRAHGQGPAVFAPQAIFFGIDGPLLAIEVGEATAATKPITLETGLVVNGPMFIKVGDMVVVDTRTASYVERAK